MSQGRQHTSGTDDALSIASKQTPQRSRSIESEERETVMKPPVKKSIFARVPRLPLAFLGIALYRAWIELAFVGSYLGTSLQAETSRNLFDGTMVVAFLLGAIFAKQLSPLIRKRTAHWMALSFLLVSTTCVVIGAIHPDMTNVLMWPAAICGGIGVAVIVILWSELYGCLGPVRVALYYSASIVAAALIVYTMKGFLFPWFATFLFMLPIGSLVSLSLAFDSLSEKERPSAPFAEATFPWKLAIWMAAYSFAYGLAQSQLTTSIFGPHSSPGVLAIGAFVFFGVALRKRKFDFSAIFHVALPLAVAAFLFVPVVGNFNQTFTALCIAAAYTACSILLMIILTNMCYRQGISALWLFCIERSVRMIFNALGREARDPILELSIGIDSSYILSIVVVILVIVSSIILLTERSITAQWGIGIKTSDAKRAEEIVREDLLKNRSREIALNYRLSLREEEILTLLAQRKRNTAIASELFISEQTVKTHIRNLYKKLDVHSRDELFDLVENIDAKRAITSSVDEDYR